MRRRTPVQVIVHFPTTEEGERELARRVSEVHADFVLGTLNRLNCPAKQKLALLQAVIDADKGLCKAPERQPEASSEVPRDQPAKKAAALQEKALSGDPF